MSDILFSPVQKTVSSSHVYQFLCWVNEQYDLNLSTYKDLHQWSLDDYPRFWEVVLKYFDITYSGSYAQIYTGQMPKVHWFEGISLNYAEEMEIRAQQDQPLIYHFDEQDASIRTITHEAFFAKSKGFASYLRSLDLQSGDRVAAYLPNIPEAAMACHASIGQGFVWSCCSPDFGVDAVVERFAQISPKVLVVATAYSYNGKIFDRSKEVAEIINKLPELISVIYVPFIEGAIPPPKSVAWNQACDTDATHFSYSRVAFDHPIWVLYSSGTTGKPKAITHRHGGMLLEHLKYLVLQNDVRRSEKFFWYSTTGWMMWNFSFASILAGASLVIYDGSPALGGIDFLWNKAAGIGINHFGTSASFLIACMKKELDLQNSDIDLSRLRTIGSTGSPLPPETFKYVYEYIKQDLFLCSMSGGTDVCTAFVGSNMMSPVYEGYIQGTCLGVDLVALDDEGNEVVGQVGEMYIRKPLPNMPVYFWNDAGYEKYKASYFDGLEGYWRHGDWMMTAEHGGVMMLGRSDATLNRNGVRIGTAEIYNVLNDVSSISDALIVNIEMKDGSSYMPLFVIPADGGLTDQIRNEINALLKTKCSPRYVPDEIIEVGALPYTISGKKMEAPVKKILMGHPAEKSYTKDAMRNPESMEFFIEFRSKFKERETQRG